MIINGEHFAPHFTMYDIFFLSNGEPSAETNWQYVRKNWPWAKRVKDVNGIKEAHQACAKKALTTNFFVVDADNIPDEDFPFDLELEPHDREFVHIWFARNDVTEPYGWGGVKLFPRAKVLAFTGDYLDFSTSFELKVIEEPKSTNKFNTSPFDAWRSAVREAYKLSKSSHNQSQCRLNQWLSPSCDYSEYIAAGANFGVSLVDATQHINDWEWLRSKFDAE